MKPDIVNGSAGVFSVCFRSRTAHSAHVHERRLCGSERTPWPSRRSADLGRTCLFHFAI